MLLKSASYPSQSKQVHRKILALAILQLSISKGTNKGNCPKKEMEGIHGANNYN